MIAVAIDGPSGAGKSTLAHAVAEKLGFVYVDTGACYRGITLVFLENKVNIANELAVIKALSEISLDLLYENGEQRIFVNSIDVSEAIRTPEVTKAVSEVSAIPLVRKWLLEFQRELAKGKNVIMDGRDIGTVVLPNAQVKIFMTASAEARAERRYKDFLAKGTKIEYNDVLENMRQRDLADSTREIAPLTQAEDAILLDTTCLSFEEALKRIVEIVKGCE